ncbi:MAG: hypothetical protein A3J55_03875 [Candidatus Ryanbacteria bacterium RIFCSPHIGHO2_02_FULL_45_17b]|uniref:Uncharacterized protein n=1 Tax=Candidatus Ryanbacteria bacterium RIFCSPHIGHO2_01_FULL_45_22 TaxID=1802114 RepID=A0A1G2FYG3_9BACT|nr:MAG: hypothetical protein A2719_02015 [Candidatus Ryanbacteria bacterium RIFCSPHIGHO2_01_FULL_45_22]OGZ46419.1 MAG: hypothetical protein A3J55_03875 [Candidatus Ryanbacteria bacterium RIFCSPHIGHO2_02_FULL_45_17b]
MKNFEEMSADGSPQLDVEVDEQYPIDENEELPADQGFQKNTAPFYPKTELDRIKSIPDAALKREELERFKETLAYQQEGAAGLQLALEHEIRQRPNISEDVIKKMIADFTSEHRLNDQQITLVEYALAEYRKKHTAVASAIEQYPEPSDLFTYVFGKEPLGRVEVIPGPMTLFFSCEDLRDYALIYSQSFVNGMLPREEEIAEADSSGGVSIPLARQYELRGTLIASKGLFSSNRKDGKLRNIEDIKYSSAKSILIHEEQHAIHKIFRQYNKEGYAPLEYYDFHTPPENEMVARENLTHYLRTRRIIAEVRAKDELLAFLKTGNPYSDTLATLLKPQSEGGLYDYLRSTQLELESKAEGGQWDFEYQKILPEIESKVFSEEYIRLLKKGIEAFKTVSEEIRSSREIAAQKGSKEKYKLSPAEETVAYLEHHALRYWPRVAMRMKHRQMDKEYEYSMSDVRGSSQVQYDDDETLLRLPKQETSAHRRTGKNDRFRI